MTEGEAGEGLHQPAPTILDESCGTCERSWRDDGPRGNKAESTYARDAWHRMKHGHRFEAVQR